MDVKVDLPFTFCEKCRKQDLDLHHSTYYSGDAAVLNDVYLTCWNSNLCEYIVDRIKNGDFQLNDKGA